MIKNHIRNFLSRLKAFTGERPDLIVCNYVYDHLDEGIKKSMDYKNVFPIEKQCTWDEIGKFYPSQYLIMHSLMFQTKVLRESEVKLPEHTFYVDNLFAFQPLPYVYTMYYLDVDLYRYFIGRDDQSVNEKVMIKRIDQQIRVNKLMVNAYINCKSTNKHLKKYMFSYLDIITTISSIMLIRANTEESLHKKKELLEYIKTEDKQVYRKLRHSLFGKSHESSGRGGRKIVSGSLQD